MCLLTNDATIKIATKPIIVYKGLCYKWGRASSSAMCYEYKRFKMCPSVQLNPRINDRNISPVLGNYRLEEGYHSYNEIEYKPLCEANSVFIIPKGAKYVEGWYNDEMEVSNRVSETIIYMGKRGIFTSIAVFFYKLFN